MLAAVWYPVNQLYHPHLLLPTYCKYRTKNTVLLKNIVHVFFVSHGLKTLLTYLKAISSFESCKGECLCGLFVISPSSLWSSTSISETSYSDMTTTSYSYFNEHTKHVLQSGYNTVQNNMHVNHRKHTHSISHLWSETKDKNQQHMPPADVLYCCIVCAVV